MLPDPNFRLKDPNTHLVGEAVLLKDHRLTWVNDVPGDDNVIRTGLKIRRKGKNPG